MDGPAVPGAGLANAQLDHLEWHTMRAWKSSKLSSKDITLVGISLGFAVGSVTTYGIFALFVWFGLLYIVISNKIKVTSLFVIPLISIATFFILNPYIIFNFESYILEYQSQSTWFNFEVSFNSLINLPKHNIFWHCLEIDSNQT